MLSLILVFFTFQNDIFLSNLRCGWDGGGCNDYIGNDQKLNYWKFSFKKTKNDRIEMSNLEGVILISILAYIVWTN